MHRDADSTAIGSRRASTIRTQVLRRVVAAGLGAFVVALSAQVVVPVSFSPVPMTLQPLAVLAVGGLLGAAGGVSALLLYIALGALGLPVFAGGGAGFLHLVGPTGGYLLAFPIAAGVTGALTGHEPRSALRVLLACALGMVIIHTGGVAQLALLGGDPALAMRVGFVPFLTGDLLKVGLAAALILVAGPRVRSLL
ncbi:MAG: biotin transport system substrate-specific component [Gemmatimonadales bacterium]|jgi:biotin transport system substrate-specific component|nr:biotin transport system substrate-specific component [Gemmatimonadales bacterium]